MNIKKCADSTKTKVFTKESQLQKKLKETIIARFKKDVWYYHPCDRTRVGVPDIIMCLKGSFVAIEVKKNIHIYGATQIQKHNCMLIHQSGGHAIIDDDIGHIMRELEWIYHAKG
jgi:hypothetical protein